MPDLDDVVFLGGVFGAEIELFAIGEERVATADRGVFDESFDEVIRQQHVVSAGPVVENKEGVFPVGADDPLFKSHIEDAVVERLDLAAEK